MLSVAEFQRRLQSVTNKDRLENFVAEIIFQDEKSLIAEKIDEFTHGVRPNGDIIGTYKDPEYGMFKATINPLAKGNVDLMVMRKFVGSLILIRTDKNKYIFNAHDIHNLIGRYGQDIMGLNAKWFEQKQKEDYAPRLLEKIKQYAKI
jgi:hypothetical protein